MSIAINSERESLKCATCQSTLVPMWVVQEQVALRNEIVVKTGRKRRGCTHLVCYVCKRQQVNMGEVTVGTWYFDYTQKASLKVLGDFYD